MGMLSLFQLHSCRQNAQAFHTSRMMLMTCPAQKRSDLEFPVVNFGLPTHNRRGQRRICCADVRTKYNVECINMNSYQNIIYCINWVLNNRFDESKILHQYFVFRDVVFYNEGELECMSMRKVTGKVHMNMDRR